MHHALCTHVELLSAAGSLNTRRSVRWQGYLDALGLLGLVHVFELSVQGDEAEVVNRALARYRNKVTPSREERTRRLQLGLGDSLGRLLGFRRPNVPRRLSVRTTPWTNRGGDEDHLALIASTLSATADAFLALGSLIIALGWKSVSTLSWIQGF